MYEAVRSVIGAKWTLEILAFLAEHGTSNYTAIEAALDTSSDVVVGKLELLAEYGLVDRSERSQRDVRYSITAEGEAVLEAVEKLQQRLAET